MELSRIRNFSIIAHIDHGKSTLSDRILEVTGAVDARDMREQYLDSMDLERERGITIKAQNVRVEWKDHVFHLIDTPGHVDFGYEVSRSLAACEGVVLVVDAAQGIEAQTLANCYLALEHDLEIVAALNKIDLPAAEPDRYAMEIENVLGIAAEDILRISAKTGEGVPELLDAVIERIPPPRGDPDAPLQALIFDSQFDQYRGVVSSVRVVNGRLGAGSRLRFMQAGAQHEAIEIGVRRPVPTPVAELGPGEVGYLIAGIKDVGEARSGETVTTASHGATDAAARLSRPQADGLLRPVPDRRRRLRGPARLAGEAQAQRRLDHLHAGDVGRPRVRVPLRVPRPAAHGDRQGAPGAGVRPRPDRHRAERRVPGAPHRRRARGRRQPGRPAGAAAHRLRRGAVLQGRHHHARPTYTGTLMELCQQRRGELDKIEYLSPERVELHYLMPLAEVVVDFFDQLKSRSQGYASLDYEPAGYRRSNLVKVDLLLNGVTGGRVLDDRPPRQGLRLRPADGREAAQLIPRQMFDVPIQAAIGGKIIARETVKAKRKDVLAKCYGGDITRKRKLLEKQKEGKKKMKSIGRVEVPGDVFISALCRLDDCKPDR